MSRLQAFCHNVAVLIPAPELSEASAHIKKNSQIQAMNIKILIVCRFLLLPNFTTVSSACTI
jgi:hypothetical protein